MVTWPSAYSDCLPSRKTAHKKKKTARQAHLTKRKAGAACRLTLSPCPQPIYKLFFSTSMNVSSSSQSIWGMGLLK